MTSLSTVINGCYATPLIYEFFRGF